MTTDDLIQIELKNGELINLFELEPKEDAVRIAEHIRYMAKVIRNQRTQLTHYKAVEEAARKLMQCDTKIFISYGAEERLDNLAEALRAILRIEKRKEDE